MAADFIALKRTDAAAVFVQELVNLPNQLRSVIDNLEKVQQKGFRMFETGPPLDFTEFEKLYGIPVGSGEAVFNMINGTLQALAGTSQNANAEDFMSQVG